jgi:3-oxo-5-alpha-steroid 4-dehydrogenase 1
MDLQTFEYICYAWIGTALIAHVALFFVTAPFGRHTSDKWGPSIDNKLGWFMMEFPSLLIMFWFLMFGEHSFDSNVFILFMLWIFHYLNRAFIYPIRIKPTNKKMPALIVINGIIFNAINAGLNGYFLAMLADPAAYGNEWLVQPNFITGVALFVTGMMINWKSDDILISLRHQGETGYVIPRGFLFEYISCPNLFGEIIEWTGFALMAWNLPALTVAVWTFASLVPRARNHHRWYHARFPDYPGKRKMVFPFLL